VLRLTSRARTTPLVISRFSSHAFMSRCSSPARLLCASVIMLPSRRVRRCCAAAARF
jgi:hypothetical protein